MSRTPYHCCVECLGAQPHQIENMIGINYALSIVSLALQWRPNLGKDTWLERLDMKLQYS